MTYKYRELNQDIFIKLERRLGRKKLGKRLQKQVDRSSIGMNSGKFKIYWGNINPLYTILKGILKSVGLFNRGKRNALDYRIEKVDITIPDLSIAFDQFRILHLSDLHTEGITDKGRRLMETIREMDYDVCVMTGDFRSSINGDYTMACRSMERLMEAIQCEFGVYGVLGNHDFIEMVPLLENMGIRILLNEAVRIQKEDDAIWIAGVDDPYLYQCHDIHNALKKIPESAFSILLAHSPNIIKEAAQYPIDYYLCGHTHGGQICLPNGIPVITNAACSRKYVMGPWRYNNLSGYTSRGTGAAGLPVRFQCPPEITLHRLVRGQKKNGAGRKAKR